jgi:integrase
MPQILATELQRHREGQTSRRLLSEEPYQNHDLVFCNEDGTPFSRSALTAAFHDLIGKVDLPPVSFHALRHSAATLLLGRDVGVKVVQDTLGHSTPTLTLGTYGHVLKAHKQEAARHVDAALGNVFAGEAHRSENLKAGE